MSMERASEFLKALESDSQLGKAFEGLEKPADEKEIPAIYAKIAKENGYDVTAEDLLAALEEKTKAQKEKSRLAAKDVETVGMEELDKVAGGNEHQVCWDTFKDYEACWISDACDWATAYYYWYKCNVTHDDWKG